MSIRFRLSQGTGCLYGAIVNTYRDKASGKVVTRSLKSFGRLSSELAHDPSFLAEVEKEVKHFKEQAKASLKLADATLPAVLPRAFLSLPVLRHLWLKLGFDRLLRDLKLPSRTLNLELCAFAFCALEILEPEASLEDKRPLKNELITLPDLQTGSYQRLLSAIKTHHQALHQALRISVNHKLEASSQLSFYLTKYYFSESKTQSVHPVLLGLLFNEEHEILDIFLHQEKLRKSALIEKLQGFEEYYAPLKLLQPDKALTLVCDTELNDLRSLKSLHFLGYHYVLVRNMFKFPRRLQSLMLKNVSFQNAYSSKGNFIYKYSEQRLPLKLRQKDGSTAAAETRLIIILSESKRSHDLKQLQRQWEQAQELMLLEDSGQLDDNEKPMGLMHFVRRKSDLKASFELDAAAYKNHEALAGCFVIVTNLDLSVHEIYQKLRRHWRDKEFFRDLKACSSTSALKFHDELTAHFLLRLLSLSFRQAILARLSKAGLNLSPKKLREVLREVSITRTPASAEAAPTFIKNALLGDIAEDGSLLSDAMLQAFELKPMPAIFDLKTLDAFIPADLQEFMIRD